MSAETPDLFLPNTGAKLQNTGATAETAIREALAAGPTPGVWVSDSACGLYAMNVTSAGGDLHVATVLTGRPARASDRAVGDIESTAHGRGNQLLITACNPASITELLAELDRLRATPAPGAPGQELLADVLKDIDHICAHGDAGSQETAHDARDKLRRFVTNSTQD